MLVLELLKWAAADSPRGVADRIVALLGEGHEREVRWVLDAGLGPMLYRATREHFDYVPSALRDVLLSSDLTAQVRHACVIDTANEVIDVCRELGTPVTLLKGISISDQHYPSGHLRPMGDIDILIPTEAYHEVESAMLLAGYVREPCYELSDTAPHGIPLLNPDRGVWVELHTDLFEGTRPNGVFSSSHVADQSVASNFQGRTVQRLTDELQLLYMSYSWFQDMSRYTIMIQPSSLAPLFDAVHLLRARKAQLDCSAVLARRENHLPPASLYAMLAFLARHGMHFCAPVVLSRLASGQNLVGALQLRIIHAVLDYCLISGRPWRLAVPPPLPGRYSVRHQLRKRWRAGRFIARSPF